MSRLKLTPIQFYHSTPIEIEYALKDGLESQHAMEENIARPIAEAVRLSAFLQINMQLKKGSRIKEPKKLIMFPWDVQERKRMQPASQEELKNKVLNIAKMFSIKKDK
jgi:hypothetical protein